jgi:hypothetical protein
MPTADDAHPVTRTPAASQAGHGQGVRTMGGQLTLLAVVMTGSFMAMLDTTIVPAPVPLHTPYPGNRGRPAKALGHLSAAHRKGDGARQTRGG